VTDDRRKDDAAADPTLVDRLASVSGPAASVELTAGAHFAGFVIERVAGRGGMGVVYQARQLRPARTVALKVVSPEFADDAEFRTRFEHECEIAASIEHSNVIPVYAVGDEAGLLYIAMRYVDGTDLGAALRAEDRLDPGRATRILSELTAALDAAHAHGLVHRDIKPGNVLLAREADRDHVYLTDFGLAKPASTPGRTRVGAFVGTLDYAAPEQLQGQRVDARTDVYAAGCLLYEMLTGHVPFEQEHEASIIYAHITSPPPSVRALVPDLPQEIDAVIARAMAKNPDERYPSAGDLGRAADAAAGGEGASASERSVATGPAAPAGPAALASAGADAPATPPPSGPVTARGPVTPARRPSRGLIAAAVGGALALVVIIVVIASGALGGSHQRTVTVHTTPTPTVKTYRDASLGISFSYPAAWESLRLPGVAADFGIGAGTNDETRCALEVQRGVGPAGSSQLAQFAFVRDRSASAARQIKHYEVRAIQAEPAQNVTGVGLVRVAGSQGGHLGFFFRGRDVYVFDCITPAARLDQVSREQFEPLLHSVRFG
jgi:predicted Ser/Thr protein kinase